MFKDGATLVESQLVSSRTSGWFRAALVWVWLCMVPPAALSELVINEIMYHPSNVLAAAEWIELYNPGPAPVSLASYRFDNGIEYEFETNLVISAGGYLVVCEDTNVFAALYPSVTSYAGGFSGNLDNGGERLTLSKLVADEWVTADTVRYNDRGLWPVSPDGQGPSVELVHAGYDNEYGESWAGSAGTGTPGAQNSVYSANPPPRIAEVAHDPPLPFAGSAIGVTAYVFGHDAAALTVTVQYRRDQTPAVSYTQTPMFDDGQHADGLAGDGIYGAMLPGLPEQAVMDFQITATDSNGPSYTAPSGAGQTYLCYFGDDPGYTGEHRTYHLLMTQANRTELETRDVQSNVLLDGTVILSDGGIYYNCGLRYRGSSSRVHYTGPSSYRVELPPGRRIDDHREVNLNACNPLLQFLGMKVFEDNGIPTPHTKLCRVWLNEDFQEQTGEGWMDPTRGGIYVQVDKIGRDFLADNYPGDDEGNLYRNGDLLWAGTDPDNYKTGHSYIKETNVLLDDWTDIRDTCQVFNDPPNAAFPDGMEPQVNVQEWIDYFATHVVLNNNEAGIALGSPSDYYHYWVPSESRRDLLPWDLDSVIDQSGTSWSCDPNNKSIWMCTVPSITNFLRHPKIAPRFLARLVEIADTTLSVGQMQQHFDAIGPDLTADFRSKLEDSLTSRRNYIYDNVNFDLTANVSGATVGLVTIVTSSTISLSGVAPQPHTQRVCVNGADGTWKPYPNGDWSLSGVSVENGMNRLLIEARDGSDLVRESLALDVIRASSWTTKSGTISSDTTWGPSPAVVKVTGNVQIASGKKLTVAAGTVVMLSAGVSITTSGGTLDVQGAESNKVYFVPADAASEWGRLSAAGASGSLLIRHAELAGGRLFTTNSAVLTVEDSRLRDYSGNIIESHNAGLATIRRCHLSNFNETHFRNTPLLAEYSLFEDYSGDAIDCADTGVKTHTIRRCTARNAHGTSADGIDFEPVRHAVIEDCLIHDLDDRGLSISGSTNVTVRGTVVYRAVDGMGIKDGSHVVLTNCTVVNCDRGLHLEEDLAGGPGYAVGHNNIVWENETEILLEDGAAIDLTYSDVLMTTGLYPGTSNISAYPLFAKTVPDDYRLQAQSPCIGRGKAGGTIGALYPVGAAPATPDGLALRNITTNQIAVSWRDNSMTETRFEIERALDGTNWLLVGSSAADTTNYVDTTVALAQTYHYRVRAANPRGVSFYTASASITAAFSLNTQHMIDALRITEIMYHPRDGVLDGDEYEFLELKNTGVLTLDLSGVYFSKGIDYTFEPGTTLAAGQFFVLARNPTAFATRYPSVSVDGTYTNSALSNGGETIRLKDADKNTIFAVDPYDDSPPWYPTTDGEGYSLVLVDPDWDPDDPGTWRASTNLDGSPGADDPAPPYSVVYVNEVLAHTDLPLEDAIELVNASTSTAVDVSGWYLSDSGNDVAKYQIPASTIIGPGGFAVFYEYQFNYDTNDPSCFGLSEHGEQVYLSSATTNGQLTSYRTRAKFGASPRGSSFGRYCRSDGEVDFVAMSSRTFGEDDPGSVAEFRLGTGLSNAYPRVGPIVINEIMYHPLVDGSDEFIELYNITGSNVPLYDVSYPSNTWKLSAACDFVFPTGTVLAAGGYLLVTRSDPELFRSEFQIPQSIPIFGPWDGKLSNDGESVKLYRPGTPDPGGLFSYIRMDRVKYNDAAPWPEAADGTGPSLERRVATQYGNDPTNWVAATPGGTPGQANNVNAEALVAFADAVSFGKESVAQASIPVLLSKIAAGTVTVDYQITGGTAVNGVDYTLNDGTLTFLSGETNRPIVVSVTSDSIVENLETVELTLSGASGAWAGPIQQHVFTIADVDFAFSAYNDFCWASGQTSANITLYTIGQSGALVDHDTGQQTDVSLAVSGGSGPMTDQGASANPGTDAYDVFGGIVDGKGVISYSSTSEVRLDFTGMNPQLTYEIAVFGNRNQPSYTSRTTKCIITGAPSFVNDSTPGASVSTTYTTGDSTTSVNGYNTQNGYVARYSQVESGGDGAMRITVPAWSGSGEAGRYYLNAVMVRAGGSSLVLAPPTISPNGASFADTISVTLATPEPAAMIFYTTDGTTPTVDSLLYSAPIVLNQCAKVKARTFRAGYQASEIASAIFTRILRTVSFAQASSSGSESVTLVNLPVDLDPVAGSQVTVDYAVTGGTASNGVDFTLQAGTLTFGAGASTANIAFSVADDGLEESDETLTVWLSDPANTLIGAVPGHTYTIVDNDLYIKGTVTENGGGPLVGATVEYAGPTSGSVQTDGNGRYTILAVPGQYDVLAKAPGYQASAIQEATVPPSVVNHDFELYPSALYTEPTAVAATLAEGQSDTRTLHLVNSTGATVAWSLSTGLTGEYTLSDSDTAGGPTYSWIEIASSGTRVNGLGDDSNVGVNMGAGFLFPFYGNTFTNLRVCSNGFLSFTYTGAPYNNLSLPHASGPENLLAVLWDDLNLSAGGSVYYQQVDANTFVIEYTDVRYYGYDSVATFEVILKADGTILYQYKRVDRTSACTVGIQNADRDNGILVAYNESYLHADLAVRFQPGGWLTADPTSGSLVTGRIHPITLTLDAAKLGAGTHQATLHFTTDDVNTPTMDVPVTLTVTPADNLWFIAYNDLCWSSGQISQNITTFTTTNGTTGYAHSGPLVDYRTGLTNGVRVEVQGGSGLNTGGGVHPANGTDAHNVFDTKVNCNGTMSYGTTDLTLRFTGLDPTLKYEFVLYADRGDPAYSGASSRDLCATLLGADALENDSTTGTTITTDTLPNDTTLYNAGYNYPYGLVARFIDVDPGADGQFTVRVKRDAGLDYYTYANAFMIRAFHEAREPVTRIAKGATWQYLRGSTEASQPPSAWRGVAFDDSAWSNGPAAFGFGGLTYGTDLSDMKSTCACFFLRKRFVVDVPSLVSEARFRADFDDGFILWLNGEEIARRNVPGAPGAFNAYDSLASFLLVGDSEWVESLSGASLPVFLEGTNVLAVQVFNTFVGNYDMLMDFELSLIEGSALPQSKDADRDGMADGWELICFGSTNHTASADFDLDGISNMGEYISGTHPTNPVSTFVVDVGFAGGDTLQISFDTHAASGPQYNGFDRFYTLQKRDDLTLAGALWRDIEGFTDILGQGQTVAYGVPTNEWLFIYRVKARLQ